MLRLHLNCTTWYLVLPVFHPDNPLQTRLVSSELPVSVSCSQGRDEAQRRQDQDKDQASQESEGALIRKREILHVPVSYKGPMYLYSHRVYHCSHHEWHDHGEDGASRGDDAVDKAHVVLEVVALVVGFGGK